MHRLVTSYFDPNIQKQEIGKVKTASFEEDRGKISIEKVNEYIDAVLNALPNIKDLRIVLNMDQCGFGKKKKKLCFS